MDNYNHDNWSISGWAYENEELSIRAQVTRSDLVKGQRWHARCAIGEERLSSYHTSDTQAKDAVFGFITGVLQ